MPRYRVGDVVRVDPDISFKQEQCEYDVYATSSMRDLAGQTVTISGIFSSTEETTVYYTEQSGTLGWDERMFLDFEEESKVEISGSELYEVLNL